MGELAQQRSKNAAVQQFGQKLRADHAKAADEIETLLEPLNMSVPAEPSTEQESHHAALAKLSGEEFDRVRLAVAPEPVAALQGVRNTSAHTPANMRCPPSGTLVYVPASGALPRPRRSRMGRSNRPHHRASRLASPWSSRAEPRLSPDGRRLVLTVAHSDDGRPLDLRPRWRPSHTASSSSVTTDGVSGAPMARGSPSHRIAAVSYDLYIAGADGSVVDPLPLRAGEPERASVISSPNKQISDRDAAAGAGAPRRRAVAAEVTGEGAAYGSIAVMLRFGT